MTFQA